jgi:KipI family sensor histidine kinase inhibitor
MQVLAAWPQLAAAAIEGRTIEIPVAYGGEHGPDLADVAAHTGFTPAEVVRRHAAGEYVVYLLGFLPGFAFMGGLPPELATPRRAEPRVAVPARSVGIGGAQTGVYPLVSPGGWQLIGRTPLQMFDPAAAEPTLLRPGDRVRFVVESVQA